MESIVQSGLQVTYGRRLKRITLTRAICSLVVFFPELVTRNHLLVLFDNMLWLQTKSEKDQDFAKKFGLYLKVLAYILKHHRNPNPLSPKSIAKLSNSFLQNLSGFLLEKRHARGELRKWMRFVEVRLPRALGQDTRTLTKPRFIGVGYRDKGTAKNTALDGTPSWQEVASQPIGRVQ